MALPRNVNNGGNRTNPSRMGGRGTHVQNGSMPSNDNMYGAMPYDDSMPVSTQSGAPSSPRPPRHMEEGTAPLPQGQRYQSQNGGGMMPEYVGGGNSPANDGSVYPDGVSDDGYQPSQLDNGYPTQDRGGYPSPSMGMDDAGDNRPSQYGSPNPQYHGGRGPVQGAGQRQHSDYPGQYGYADDGGPANDMIGFGGNDDSPVDMSAYEVDDNDDVDYASQLLSPSTSGSAHVPPSTQSPGGPVDDASKGGADDISDAEMQAVVDEARNSVKENARKRRAEDNRDTRKSRKSVLDGKGKNGNLASKVSTTRNIVLVVAVLVLVLAVYNVLVPKHEWSQSEIAQISKVSHGETGFPMREGAGIAQQFMQAYLQDGDGSSKEILNVFYNGVTFSDAQKDGAATSDVGGSSNLRSPANVTQIIKAGPYLYSEQAVSQDGSTASYRYGTLVYRMDKLANAPIMGKDGKTPDYRWLFYQVDVYYDKTNNTFSISQNSPIRVPEPTSKESTSIPGYQLPGNGQELTDSEFDQKQMQNLISTFFKAWAASDKASLVNITDDGSLPSVYQGLNGQVVIDGNGDPSFKLYGPPSTDPYYRALVTVNWKEPVGDKGDGYTQTSTYVLKLKKSGDKFTVMDIQPYKYIPQKQNPAS